VRVINFKCEMNRVLVLGFYFFLFLRTLFFFFKLLFVRILESETSLDSKIQKVTTTEGPT